VPSIQTETLEFAIIGTAPLVYNSMSEKAKRELMLPASQQEKKQRKALGVLKHHPREEYRNSTVRLAEGPTLLGFPAPAFKAAMMDASADAAAFKTEIARLVRVDFYSIPIWGLPRLFMATVKTADQAKTPDIRTRAILPEWATTIRVTFVANRLNAQTITNLLSMAGVTQGIGDFRQGKGKGSFGTFEITDAASPAFHAIQQQGREAQDAAIADPVPFDLGSEELLAWWDAEVDRRGVDVA
jgi:hypothetical protein